MNSQPMRWGFIGAGHIAQKALAPACHAANNSILQAVAAKDENRARKLEPAGRIYSEYSRILEDDEVDAVYISLPNDAHVPLSLAALHAGKHVLCEKPLGLNAQEILDLSAVAQQSGKLMVEASWNRWHPRTKRLADLIRAGEIGELTDISAGFVYQGTRPNNYRLMPDKGGGAIYDLGPYSIAALLWLTDFAAPKDLSTEVAWAPSGVDQDAIVRCRLGSATARADVSMNRPNEQWLKVTGTQGAIELPGGQAFTSWKSASELHFKVNDNTHIEAFGPVDAYQLMVEAFADRATGDQKWVLPLEDSLAFSRFFDQIFTASR